MAKTVILGSLLNELPPREQEYLSERLSTVLLTTGQRTDPSRLWFPIRAILSMIDSDTDCDIGLIYPGEADVSAHVFAATGFRSYTVTRVPGTAYALPRTGLDWQSLPVFEQVLTDLRPLMIGRALRSLSLLNRRSWSLKQRFVWYLLSFRLTTIHISQQEISKALGVRREGITELCGLLETQGLIFHSRGRISLINIPALTALISAHYEHPLIQGTFNHGNT